MTKSFDVAVIGGGPGGYVAAIRCAQLGLSVACIDEWKDAAGEPALGGTCLNVGCIPSKALLESSENFERVSRCFPAHGITVDGARIDIGAMQARKDKIVKTLTGGINTLFRKNKVARLHGHGRIVGGGGAWQVEVEQAGKGEFIEARHLIIATGSVPRRLDSVPVDERIVDSAGALAFSEVPARLGVIGAGVIALELGSVWRRLGSNVTLFERGESFLHDADEQVAVEALRVLIKQGLAIQFGVKLIGVKAGKHGVAVEYQTGGGESQQVEFDRLLVAAGRIPCTAGLGADRVGLKLDGRGFIEVDGQCRTNLANVWAIGDVVRGPMLAHKASEEGIMVAELIAGQAGHVNYNTIPSVIYTTPEMAWVGQSEQALRQAGVAYSKGLFPFAANGRAHALQETAGFAKILADAASDRILGVHVIGPYASELIAEAVVAMEFAASAEDIARIVHAHPSLGEVMHEAALAAGRRAIHI